MRAPAVARLLRELGLPDLMMPYGFPLGSSVRLECAGGIAGRTDMWHIVQITGENSGRIIGGGWHRYKKTLRPALLEWKRSQQRAEVKHDR